MKVPGTFVLQTGLDWLSNSSLTDYFDDLKNPIFKSGTDERDVFTVFVSCNNSVFSFVLQ